MRRSVMLLLPFALWALSMQGSAAEEGDIRRIAGSVLDEAPSSTWPNEANTGVPKGAVLEVRKGDVVTVRDDQVIEELDISGSVYIKHNNVTVQRSRITAAATYQVKIELGKTGAIVQDCEINGVGTGNDGSNGIAGQGTFLRNNIYNVENGITLQGEGASLIRDNFIHDLKASGPAHYDGIQIDGSISNATITHNTIINSYNQTSAIMIDNYFGPISNITVDNNLLIGGGYTVYSSAQFNGGPVTGVSFTNNRLGKGQWGYRSVVKNNPVWRGNVDHVTGRALDSR